MSYEYHSQYAPAERASQAMLDDQCRCVQTVPLLRKTIDSIPDAVMILNAHRQIVDANRVLLDLVEVENTTPLFGLRPGEVFQCIHSTNDTGGCGTAGFCRSCGAVNAILESQVGEKEARECSITRKGNLEVLEFRVMATPFDIDGHTFTIFSLSDISHEKRRRLFERVFFHDILNFAVGLRGFSHLLKDADCAEMEEYRETIHQLSDQLIEEINTQRELTAAENNEYVLNLTRVSSRSILEEVLNVYRNYDVSSGLVLQIATSAPDISFTTDKTLVRRILGNMMKNALEASEKGDAVTLGCDATSSEIRLWVHNPGFIPHDIQLQVFRRSFSTKGSGRGWGTYGMKLLGERYLGGRVELESTPDGGTTFFLTLPVPEIGA